MNDVHSELIREARKFVVVPAVEVECLAPDLDLMDLQPSIGKWQHGTKRFILPRTDDKMDFGDLWTSELAADHVHGMSRDPGDMLGCNDSSDQNFHRSSQTGWRPVAGSEVFEELNRMRASGRYINKVIRP